MSGKKYPHLYQSFVNKRRPLLDTNEDPSPTVGQPTVGQPTVGDRVGIFNGRTVVVQDPTLIRELHKSGGCFGVGEFSKSTPQFLKNAHTAKENLLLTPEEGYVLGYSWNSVQIKRADGSPVTSKDYLETVCRRNPEFLSRLIAYMYLRTKNWVVKSGVKLGGDYLTYRKGPEFFHATYLVQVRTEGDPVMNCRSVQGINRVAQTSGKYLVYLDVSPRPQLAHLDEYLAGNFSMFKISECHPRRFIIK